MLSLITEGVDSIMETICQDCQYFVQGTVNIFRSEHIWGHCENPKNYVRGESDNKIRCMFTWSNKSCSDFKPRQKPNNFECS